MPNYKLTTRKGKECIVVDFENITSAEMKAVELYMKMGRQLVQPTKNKKTTGKGWTKDNIKHYLEANDSKGLEKFNQLISNKENYMKIMSWFKKTYIKQQAN